MRRTVSIPSVIDLLSFFGALTAQVGAHYSTLNLSYHYTTTPHPAYVSFFFFRFAIPLHSFSSLPPPFTPP